MAHNTNRPWGNHWKATADFVHETASPSYSTDLGKSSGYANYTIEADIAMTSLFEGAFNGAAAGEAEKHCIDKGGQPTGIGPKCERDEEQASWDVAECMYLANLKCLHKYLDDTQVVCAEEYHDSMMELWRLSPNMDAGQTGHWLCPSTTELETCGFDLDGRQEIVDAWYPECLKESNCECKDCIWKYPGSGAADSDPSGSGEGDALDSGDDAALEEVNIDELLSDIEELDTPGFDQVKTTSDLRPIPHIFGTYIVGGNIIWIGASENNTIVHSRQSDDGTSEIYSAENSFVDMKVGLCAGVMNKLLRVWFNGVLVLNEVIDVANLDTNDGSVALDLSILADSEYDMTAATKARMELLFQSGSESQKVCLDAVEQEGFGRVPAYRGLSYVMFRNIDIALFGQTMPNIQFEVTTVEVTTSDVKLDSISDPDISTDALFFDKGKQQLYMEDATAKELVIYDYNTLEEDKRMAYVNDTWIMSDNSILIEFDTTADSLIFTDPIAPTLRKEFAEPDYQDPLMVGTKMMATTLTVSGADGSRLEGLYYVGAVSEDIVAAFYDRTTRNIVSHTEVVTESPPVFFDTVGFTHVTILNEVYLLQLMLKPATQTEMKLLIHKVTNDGKVLPEGELVVPVIHTIANTALWGSAASGIVVNNTVIDKADNNLIVFFSTGAIAKIDTRDGTVLWTVTETDTLSLWARTSYNTTTGISGEILFISDENNIIILNTIDGSLSVKGALTDGGLLKYNSGDAQIYDAITRSIVYVSTDTGQDPTISRVFLDRIETPPPISLEYMFRRITRRMTVSTLDTCLLRGYMVDKIISSLDIVKEMASFYQLSLVELDNKLHLIKKKDATAAVILDPDHDIMSESIEETRVISTALVNTVTATFKTITDEGFVNHLQKVTTKLDPETLKTKTVDYNTTINDDPLNIRQQLETNLVSRRNAQHTLKSGIMPRRLALTPTDIVSYKGNDYRLVTETTGSEYNLEVFGHSFAQADYSEPVDFTTSSSPGQAAVIEQKTVHKDYMPVVLFTNGLNQADSLRSRSGKQVVYTAVVADAEEGIIDSTRVNLRVPNHMSSEQKNETFDVFAMNAKENMLPTSPTYRGAAHTKSSHFGTLRTPPTGTTTAPFSTDTTSQMVVEFQRPETIALFKTVAEPYYSIQETPMDNFLIIGNEYIQFGIFSVDPDGVTVTFSNLFRGLLGTENYMDHTHGENVFLYTSDTIKPMVVDNKYTKRQTPSLVFIQGMSRIDSSIDYYSYKTNAGASRSWAPTSIKIYEKWYVDPLLGDKITLHVSFLRREPYLIAHMDNLGAIPNVFETDNYVVRYVFRNDELWRVVDAMEITPEISVVANYEVPITPTVILGSEVYYPHLFQLAITNEQVNYKPFGLAQLTADTDGKTIVGHPSSVFAPESNGGTYPPAV